jgi:hypothetical protein
MKAKLTLITPPDIYENNNFSIFLAHLTQEEQEELSKWLGKSDILKNINIYLYSGEQNIQWFLYSMSRSEYKYINIDHVNYITQSLSGYMLSNSNSYYKTDNDDLAEVYSHINSGRVDSVIQFLEGIFGEQQQEQQQ